MAKEEDNKEAEGTEEEGSKGGKLKLIIIGVAALVLIGASVGLTLFLTGSGNDADVADQGEVESAPKAIYFALNPEFRSSYVVNGRQRLFQVALTLVTRDPTVVDAFSKHGPALRNRVVIALSDRSFDSLQQLDGREELRASLLAGIQEILKAEIDKPGVEEVLFTQFVMQ